MSPKVSSISHLSEEGFPCTLARRGAVLAAGVVLAQIISHPPPKVGTFKIIFNYKDVKVSLNIAQLKVKV